MVFQVIDHPYDIDSFSGGDLFADIFTMVIDCILMHITRLSFSLRYEDR